MQNLFLGTRRRLIRPLVGLCTAGLLLIVGGCELINPDEKVPSYLRIESFEYAPQVPGGPSTANIASAYVYADDLLLGIFDLPAKVPVLSEGVVKLKVQPAIYPDGQRATRIAYPFYTSYSVSPALTAGAITRLQPTTGFTNVASGGATAVSDFVVSEDFASQARQFYLGLGDKYKQQVVASPNGGGNYGKIDGKRDTTAIFRLESLWIDHLPQRGTPIFLELDYSSTMPFQIGVLTGTSASSLSTESADLVVYPRTQWTKLYVDLTSEVSSVNNSAALFRVFIKGFPTGAAGDYFAFDNVRLVQPK